MNCRREKQPDYQGDFVAIRDSLQWITIAMNDTMSRVREAAAQVDAGSTQVSNGAQALAQGTTEQASSVEELSATAQEISDKINNTADRAGIPSGLTDLFGLRVGEGDPVYEGVQARIKLDLPGRGGERRLRHPSDGGGALLQGAPVMGGG